MASYLINLISKISGDEYLVRCLKMCEIVEFNEIISIDDKTLDRMELYLQKKCSRMPFSERIHVLGDKFANNPEIFRFSPASRQRILNLVEKLDKIFNNKSFPVNLSNIGDMCNRLALGFAAPVTTVPMNALKMLMYPGNMLGDNTNESSRVLQSKPNEPEITAKSVPLENAPTQRFTNIFQKMDAIRNGDVDLSKTTVSSPEQTPLQNSRPSNKENIDQITEPEVIEMSPKSNKRKLANGIIKSDSLTKIVSISPSENETSINPPNEQSQSSQPASKKRKYVRKTLVESELRVKSQRLMRQKLPNPVEPDEISKEPSQIETAIPDSPLSPEKPEKLKKLEKSHENVQTEFLVTNVDLAAETVPGSPTSPDESASIVPSKKPSAKLADFLFRPTELPVRKSVTSKNKNKLMKPTSTVASNGRISFPDPTKPDLPTPQSEPPAKNSSRSKSKTKLLRSVASKDASNEALQVDVSLPVSIPSSLQSDPSPLSTDLATSEQSNKKSKPKSMQPVVSGVIAQTPNAKSPSPSAILSHSGQPKGVPTSTAPTKKAPSLKLSDFPFQRLDFPPAKNPKKSRLMSSGQLSRVNISRSSPAPPPVKLANPAEDSSAKFVIKTTDLSKIKIPKLSSSQRPPQNATEANNSLPAVGPPPIKVHHLSAPNNAVVKHYGPGRTLSTFKLSNIHRFSSPIGVVSSSVLSLQSSYDQAKLAPCRFQPSVVPVALPSPSSPPASSPSSPLPENAPPNLLETDTSSSDAMDVTRSMSPPVIKSIVTSATAADPVQLSKSFDLSSIKPVWTNSPSLVFSNRFINSNKHRNLVSSCLSIESKPDPSATTIVTSIVKLEPTAGHKQPQPQSPAVPAQSLVVTKAEPTLNI